MTAIQEKVFTGKDSGEKEAESGPEDILRVLWPYVDGQYVPDMPLDWIAPWARNPRKVFEDAALMELAESIEMDGVRQPIEVRTLPAESREDYPAARAQIVMGERRWRASKLAGRLTIPCIVRVGMDDATALRLAVVENLRRTDLNAIEEADSYGALLEAGYKQYEIAAQIGVSEGTISNALRLRRLPADVRQMVVEGKLTGGHARALLRFEGFDAVMTAMAQMAFSESVPVRMLEKGVPFQNWLSDRGEIKVYQDYSVTFPIAVCDACPFDAHLLSEHRSNICLKPEHWHTLETAAKAEKQARIDAAKAEMMAKKTGKPLSEAFVPAPPEDTYIAFIPSPDTADTHEYTDVYPEDEAQKARQMEAESEPPLLLSDLMWDNHVRIDDNPPPGCSADCHCRWNPLDDEGRRVPVCFQPGRYKNLKAQETAVKNKARRARFIELWSDFTARKFDGEEVGRGYSLLLMGVIQNCPTEVRRDVIEGLTKGERLFIPLPPELAERLGKYIGAYDGLAIARAMVDVGISVPDMYELAIQCLIAAELRQKSEMNSDQTPEYDFLMGIASPEPEPLAASARSDGTEEATEAALDDAELFHCATCNAVIPSDVLKDWAWEAAADSALRHTSGVLAVGDPDENDPADYYCAACAPNALANWEDALRIDAKDAAAPAFTPGQRVAALFPCNPNSAGDAQEWRTGIVFSVKDDGNVRAQFKNSYALTTFHPADLRLMDVQFAAGQTVYVNPLNIFGRGEHYVPCPPKKAKILSISDQQVTVEYEYGTTDMGVTLGMLEPLPTEAAWEDPACAKCGELRAQVGKSVCVSCEAESV